MQPLLTSEPTRIGDYRLLARLGKGSMGAVYLGRSRGGRIVAVKVVRPDLAEDPEFRERFQREAKIARSVGGFWTAAVVDADPDAEQPWLATEYVPGPNLHQAVTEHGPLPEHTVRSLAAGLSEALAAIHRAALVHRDLKPANVLLGPDGPRVIDFGISRAMDANSMTATGMFFGTPGYFSPEQTAGSEVGPPSDVFSLGAVLVFAATGNGPFGNEHTAAMLYRVVHSEPDLSQVPETLRPMLAGCLAKDPAARPAPSDLLDQVGESSPQGNQWLPPAVTALISEHTTQLQRTANAAASEDTPRPAAEHKPSTRAYTGLNEQPKPPPPPPPAPPPSRVEQTAPIAPARPRATAQQPVQQPRPQRPLVSKDNPGPVFKTGRRVPPLLWAAFLFGLAWGGVAAAYAIHGVPRHFVPAANIALTVLVVLGSLSLLKVLRPALRLKINSDGIRISRLGLSREISWNQINRVGLVGRGKREAVAVWVPDGAQRPKPRWWHWTRRYHGGTRLFPIGATGVLWTRRKEVKRLRLALQQYAPRVYDPRLL